ncbi:MAG: double-cubane-cluster-containing anaerobic reductase [Syntrophomonadaceae bacterium]|jgi:benzoyl-CoA reductase/2-hydroxyglutaryl-CoA dehydratase subunit BcrC/BadD/HgdB|nr:double-cubane-cluster-containing anaerobic reductase [Syntrophomonadaceae bacterium]MDH7496965.1 double-cubane-cluster-containing anaerobic reductase [Syntrophomonadaceae bacterium]
MFDQRYQQRITERVFVEGWQRKQQGALVVGTYCAFTPEEIIMAAGAVPVSLCAGSPEPITAAERVLPRNLCPLIKSSFGHALQDDCPYLAATDLIFADATCDGKKKMFELLAGFKPLHLLQLPQTYGTPASLRQWLGELQRMKAVLEAATGREISDSALQEQVRLHNRLRHTVSQVYALNQGPVPLVYGREIDCITGAGGFSCNLEARIGEMEEAILLARERGSDAAFQEQMREKPRILLTGCPSTNRKLLDALEDSGAVVVAMETCGGLKTAGSLVDENAPPLPAIAMHSLQTACPCMTPNPRRLDILRELVDRFAVDGVVELTWTGCHTYNVEATLVKEAVVQRFRKPYLQVETDYSLADCEQLRVRVEAFLEILKHRA